MIFPVMKSILAPGKHPKRPVAPGRRLAAFLQWAAPNKLLLAAMLTAPLAAPLGAGGCGFKTPPRPAVEALPPTADFQVRQRGEALLISWRAVGPEAAARFGGVRGYRFLLQRHPVFCGVCPPDSTRTVTIGTVTIGTVTIGTVTIGTVTIGTVTIGTGHARAGGSGLRREGARITYRLSAEIVAGGSSSGGPALLRVRMVTLYGSGENRPTGPALLEPPAPMAAPRLMWRWTGAQPPPAGAPGSRKAQLYWKAQREGVLRVTGAGGKVRERETFLRANLYRRHAPGPWPLTPLNGEPLETGRWSVTRTGGSRELGAPEPGGAEYVLRWIDRSGNEGPPSTPVRIGQPENNR